jgi:hypothetical protein
VDPVEAGVPAEVRVADRVAALVAGLITTRPLKGRLLIQALPFQ